MYRDSLSTSMLVLSGKSKSTAGVQRDGTPKLRSLLSCAFVGSLRSWCVCVWILTSLFKAVGPGVFLDVDSL